MKKSKSNEIIPLTLYKHKDYKPIQIGQQQHISDYYALTDQRYDNVTKNSKKDKKIRGRCYIIGSSQDHSKSLSKLQQTIHTLNKQKINFLLQNQKIRDNINYLTKQMYKLPNQKEQKYIFQIQQRSEKVNMLKLQLEIEDRKHKNQLKQYEQNMNKLLNKTSKQKKKKKQ